MRGTEPRKALSRRDGRERKSNSEERRTENLLERSRVEGIAAAKMREEAVHPLCNACVQAEEKLRRLSCLLRVRMREDEVERTRDDLHTSCRPTKLRPSSYPSSSPSPATKRELRCWERGSDQVSTSSRRRRRHGRARASARREADLRTTYRVSEGGEQRVWR